MILTLCGVAAGLGWALQPFRNADVAFLTAVAMNTTVCWDVTPCRWLTTADQLSGTEYCSLSITFYFLMDIQAVIPPKRL
jgi:hypothetical protein